MNRHGVKQLTGAHGFQTRRGLRARSGREPAAVCTDRCAPGDGLPFGETKPSSHSLVRMMTQRDGHTAGHCERVALSGVALGVALRLDSASLQALYVGGYVHDIGKVGVPDSVLLKPGKLNAEEWEIMRAHPVCGEEICRPLTSLRGVLPLIRHHHERWDGTGYPDGLRETEIPLLARVLQVVDIYDALTRPRPYKHAYSSCPRAGYSAGRNRPRMARPGDCRHASSAFKGRCCPKSPIPAPWSPRTSKRSAIHCATCRVT